MSRSKSIDLDGVELILHSDLSVSYGPDTLLIADVHIGKTMHFRRNGFGVPAQIAQKELDRLSGLLDYHRPKELIILGDLFHSKPNKEWDLFSHWVKQYAGVHFQLILGNHDSHLDSFNLPSFSTHPSLEFNGLTLQHHPPEEETKPTVCGHVHPAFRLKGIGKQSLKLPCFHLNQNTLTLPSFGRFTGSYSLRPKKGDSLFLTTGKSLEQLDF